MMKNISLMLFVAFLFTACEKEEKLQKLNTSCLEEYEQYNPIIANYKIRMVNIVKEEGCKAISVYASIIEAEEFDILDKVDENPKLMKKLIHIFTLNKSFSSMIVKNSTLKKILLNNSLNDNFIENFTYLVEKKLHKKEIRKIEKDNHYLNYTLLSALYAKDKKDSKKLYAELKSSIPIDMMPSFVLVHSAMGEDYDFRLLVENFRNLQKKLSSEALKELALYPKYFAYFLYPNKEDLGIDSISSSKLREIQESMQEKVLYLYEEMFNKYRYSNGMNEMDYALLSVEYIYPYLLTQHSIGVDDFSKLLRPMIKNAYMLSLFSEGKCSNKTKENFAVFGENNILNAIKLLKNEKGFTSTLFNELKEPNYSVMSFFYVANLYGNLNREEWKIFKELLVSLPYGYDNKIAFIQKIEKAGYFRNIVQQPDYKEIIDGDSDYGEKNPKYKYVLLTPYPSQKDKTLFDTILYTNISDDVLQRSLVTLIGKNKEELETHEFTKSEKFFGNVDKLDTIVMVASIGLVPFTGGMSLAYVATRVASKVAAKKGIKYLSKKIALKSRKLLNKGIYQVRKGRKVLDNKVGVTQRNNIGEKIERLDDARDKAIDILVIARGASLFFNSNSNLKTKTICQE